MLFPFKTFPYAIPDSLENDPCVQTFLAFVDQCPTDDTEVPENAVSGLIRLSATIQKRELTDFTRNLLTKRAQNNTLPTVDPVSSVSKHSSALSKVALSAVGSSIFKTAHADYLGYSKGDSSNSIHHSKITPYTLS
ncbi:MAG: hypothetical protein H2069_05165 [Legionella sp.]|nr:hypothetical protein [Legionella sp.]